MRHATRATAVHLRERQTTSADGTRIGYTVAGRGERAWVVPPGVGTPMVTWRPAIEQLGDRYTLYVIDQRGMYTSGMPADPDAFRVADHAADVRAVVEAEGLTDYVLGGWSLAVQITLEVARRHPEGVRALLLVNGAPGRVLQTAFGIPGGDAVLKASLKAGKLLNPLVRGAMSTVMHPAIFERLGLLTRNREFFTELFDEVRQVDMPTYVRTLLGANDHDAEPFLAEIGIPALVTAGAKDRMTPLALSRRLHDKLPDSELVVFPEGTHYTPIEFPDELVATIARFLDRVWPG